MTNKPLLGVILIVSTLALSACNSQQPSGGSTANPQGTGQTETATSRDAALLSAAEPFEALTEQAATASADKLDTLIADAKSAAAGVVPSLDASHSSSLKDTLSAIDLANGKDDRTAIALAAVEGYRTLIESTSGTGAVPAAVSLLDYAGFRYQADLSAAPVRWDDALQALDFADRQWAGLNTQITDTNLRDDFTGALAAMRSAAAAKDTARARKAATCELDLVDRLEQFFTAKP